MSHDMILFWLSDLDKCYQNKSLPPVDYIYNLATPERDSGQKSYIDKTNTMAKMQDPVSATCIPVNWL